MSPNYFAPTFKVNINGSGVSADLSKHIQRVSITRNANLIDRATLGLINPYPEMRWTHNARDRRLFAIGNSVAIELGYVGEAHELFYGDITGVTAAFAESGTPTLDVTCLTRLHRLMRGRAPRPPFLNQTDKQIVEAVARDYGLKVDAQAHVTYVYANQKNQTDFDFLLELARRAHSVIRVEGRTLIFRPAAESQAPIELLEWGRHLRNFTPSIDATRQVSQVIVRGNDPKTKQPIRGKYPSSPPPPESGPRVAEQAFGSSEKVVVDFPVLSQQEADNRAQAIYEENMRGFLTVQADTVGMPQLVPGKVVEVKNVGLFSGKYSLTQVKHDLGLSGYTTHFGGTWVA